MAELIAVGTPPEIAARVVAQAFVAGVASANVRGLPVDISAEKRRAYDRERKRKLRGSPPASADIPQTSENASLSKNKIQESKKESTRGTRLPDNWTPQVADWAMARDLLGNERARAQLDTFRDYWKQQPGARGVKLDWAAAWRNWIRRAAEYRGNGHGKVADHNPRAGSLIAALDRRIAASKIEEEPD